MTKSQIDVIVLFSEFYGDEMKNNNDCCLSKRTNSIPPSECIEYSTYRSIHNHQSSSPPSPTHFEFTMLASARLQASPHEQNSHVNLHG